MANRGWRLIVLVVLVAWQGAAPARADDWSPDQRPARVAPERGWPAPTDARGWPAAPAREPLADPRWREDAPPFGGDFPSQAAPSRNADRALTEGWSWDPRSGPNRVEPNGGIVRGRLSNRGRPLVNCHVVIVPMHQEQGTYCFDPDRKPLDTVTDDQGVYLFENVPAGEYKLTWLPAGQTRWIRRIAMRPDVTVRNSEPTNLKEIRVALQTIN